MILKKITLSLFITFSFNYALKAQSYWTLDGSNNITNSNTGNVYIIKNLNVDGNNGNNGTLTNGALMLGGNGGGEGIISKKTTSGNQYGIDFFTGYNNRLSITNSGNVGIGVSSPTSKLEINGQIKITGGTPGAGKVLVSDATGLASWQTIAGVGGQWMLNGNIGTNVTTNFIGTTDNVSLVFRTNNSEKMRILNTGNIGIGTQSPSEKLEIAHSDATGGIKINQIDVTNVNKKSQIKFALKGNELWSIGSCLNNTDSSFFIWDQIAGRTALYISKKGKISIGGYNPPIDSNSPYYLYVYGGIATNDVLVTPTANFPDYVFEKNYPLLTIQELSEFVTINKHLPEIPCASEIEKKGGFEVGDMQTKLLRKIEEQTLYIIQLQNQMNELKIELNKISKK